MKKNKEITSIMMYLKSKGSKIITYLLRENNQKKITFLFFRFQIRNYGLYKNVPSVNGQVHERLLVVSV